MSDKAIGVLVRQLSANEIVIDESIQVRVRHDMDHQKYCSDRYIEQGSMMPIVVFWTGTIYLLADGFHRLKGFLEAMKQGKLDKSFIDCEVRQGSRDDAIEYSAQMAAVTSLPHTNQDRRRAVKMLLLVERHWETPVQRFALDHKVSRTLVRSVQAEIVKEIGRSIPTFMERPNGWKTQGRWVATGPLSLASDGKRIMSGRRCEGRVMKHETPEQAMSRIESDKNKRLTQRLSQNLPALASYLDCRRILNQGGRLTGSVAGRIGGSILFSGGICTTSVLGDTEPVHAAVGRLLMSREANEIRSGRMVIVCYREDGIEFEIQIAERLGIEFLNPSELSDSILREQAKSA